MKNVNMLYILGWIRVNKRVIQSMINADPVLRIKAETLAQEIKASFTQIYICWHLYITGIYVIY